MDPISAVLTSAGIALLLLSWGLLLGISFREDMTWGLCTIFLPPLAYFYGLFRLSQAYAPLGAGLAGTVLLALALT